MNKNEWKKWVGVVGRMLLAYALVFAQGAWAAQNQGTKDKSASQKAAAQQANDKQSTTATTAEAQSKQAQREESEATLAQEKSSDGRHEGIKVHGHWTIDVKNPDGTLVTHREFENSLAGPGLLTDLLVGKSVPGGFRVILGSDSTGLVGPCLAGALNPNVTSCRLVGSLSNPTPSGFSDQTDACPGQVNCFPLSIATNPVGTGIMLAGTATAGASGQITDVSTSILTCPYTGATSNVTISPSACSASVTTVLLDFTHATLSPAVPVASAGQLISVTVNISFS